MGKPVVATRLPELSIFEDLVYLDDTPKEFVEKVEIAINEIQTTTTEFRQNQVQLRKKIAAENTWIHRAKQIYLILSY